MILPNLHVDARMFEVTGPVLIYSTVVPEPAYLYFEEVPLHPQYLSTCSYRTCQLVASVSHSKPRAITASPAPLYTKQLCNAPYTRDETAAITELAQIVSR